MEPGVRSVDVVVVGSGAGGGVVAKELGEGGVTVVVLEAGPRFDPARDYTTNRQDFESVGADVFKGDPRRDRVTIQASLGFRFDRVKGVGGSTLHYLGISPRFHESDFLVRSLDGVGEDWPFRYAELEPYYTRVEYELGVSGPDGDEANPFDPPRSKRFPTPPHPFNRASQVVKRGAEKLGLHFVREPVALPSVDWMGRRACVGAGTCRIGCQIGAKSSIDVTYVPKAEATGRVEIRPGCMAREISVGADGKARGVVYFDPQGLEQEIRARAVVVAGNALETPRLLLLSRSSRFPNGLANSSGLVGKYFMTHVPVWIRGRFDERLDPWRGIPNGGMVPDFAETDGRRGFARGWTTLLSFGTHWPLSVAHRVGGWGSEHKAQMKSMFAHSVALVSCGEQLPDIRNEVLLDPDVRDSFGLPVPRIVTEPRDNDRAMMKVIREKQAEILWAAGAREVSEQPFIPGGSHLMGTCRMGTDPKTSVVNADCRAHDVPNLFIGDGSVFPTGSAVNPALTISALAARTADKILGAFARGEL
jgi:choline dehydrogenase-like flavoprotein